MTTLRSPAILAHRRGGPEVLESTEIDIPDPGPGELRIAQHAIGLNFADVYQRQGAHAFDRRLSARARLAGPGERILVHAAAGGMGLLLSARARALGAEVIGTVGSEAKREIALAHGCHHVIDYRREDFVARVK